MLQTLPARANRSALLAGMVSLSGRNELGHHQRGISDTTTFQQIVEPRRLRLQGLHHQAGLFEPRLERVPVGRLQLLEFLGAIIFESISIHRLRVFDHPLDGVLIKLLRTSLS